MVRTLLPYMISVRHLVVVFTAVMLVLYMGGGCMAVAATPVTADAELTHCADMPAKADYPEKMDSAAGCLLCIALPDASIAKVGVGTFAAIAPAAMLHDRLAGLSGAPAPPPPKAA